MHTLSTMIIWHIILPSFFLDNLLGYDFDLVKAPVLKYLVERAFPDTFRVAWRGHHTVADINTPTTWPYINLALVFNIYKC